MEFPNRRIIELMVKHFAGTADAEQAAELERWAAEDPAHRRTLDRFENSGNWEEDLEIFQRAASRSAIAEETLMAAVTHGLSVRRTRVRKMWGMSMAAACGVLALVGGGVWMYVGKRPSQVTPVTARAMLAPGRNRATLILADKKEIALDEAQTGSLAQQGDAEVKKSDSALLEYKLQSITRKPEGGPGDLAYNSVITPRAGQYKLRLVDGTVVYLNAQSSLRFPVDFGRTERRVELQGEGYFDVAKDAARPFIVDMGKGREITVLGTRFDVKNYEDDQLASATLLEGAVRVESAGVGKVLKVDDQATIDGGGLLQVHQDERADVSIAWTAGLFRFNNADLTDVLRQVGRWYDLDVELSGALPDVPITASVSRSTSAWEVLDALKQIAGLKYKVEGKKIIVSP